jgi:hypothetical protein
MVLLTTLFANVAEYLSQAKMLHTEVIEEKGSVEYTFNIHIVAVEVIKKWCQLNVKLRNFAKFYLHQLMHFLIQICIGLFKLY